jgi:ribonuclease P protein component
LRWIGNREGQLRVGIVVSKKVGKAVVRNRVRRRLREALRLKVQGLKVQGRGLSVSAADLVIIARPEAALAGYSELEHNLEHALKKSGLLA